jgi:hypothetical protein
MHRDWPYSQQLMHFALRVRELCTELFVEQIPRPKLVTIPKGPQEIAPFANLVAYGIAELLEKDLQTDIWQFMDSMKMELAKRWDSMEQRLVSIERHSTSTDNLTNRIRHIVGAYVDNWVDNYKKHKRVSPFELENVHSQLEYAAMEGCFGGMLAAMKELGVGFFEQTAEALVSRLSWLPSDFELSLPLVQRIAGDIILGVLDIGEKLASELTSPKLYKQITEAIYESTSSACRQQVELLEKYSWDYSRQADYHLSLIQFDPEANLCFSIIMRTKDPQWRGKIKELAETEGVEPWKVYQLKRRLGL